MVHESTATRVSSAPRAAQKQRRADTREAILALAERILADEGEGALALHRVAGELGYRTSALYRYFDGKDALVLALLERAVDAIAERVRGALADADAAIDRARREYSVGERAVVRLAAAGRAYLSAGDDAPAHAALVSRMLADPRPVVSDHASAARAVPVAMGVVAEIVSTFAIARQAGTLARGDDAQRAALYWSSLQGLATARKMARFGVGGGLDALGAALVRSLLIGFGASAEVVDDAIERADKAARKGERG